MKSSIACIFLVYSSITAYSPCVDISTDVQEHERRCFLSQAQTPSAEHEQIPSDSLQVVHITQKHSDNFNTQALSDVQHNVSGGMAKVSDGNVSKKTQDIFSASVAWLGSTIQKAKSYFSSLVESTKSPLIRSLLIIMLGLLMSLTPCLYPMIPITLGVLQTTASKSLFTNFLLALCYTFGMAMTFATLGLLAATGGAQFGSLLAHPVFVILFVLFLAYLAGSMIGLYDMYIPRFMHPQSKVSANGSFLSAFIFGIFSGSVASPCLSPGLVLLLSIVTTLNSMLLGFVYLFLFGVGIGIPLLIVGTFSQSLNMLPKAGNWMVEVKRLFGLMLISMCFHYLAAIIDWSVLVWLLCAVLLIGAYFFISIIKPSQHVGLRIYRYSMAFGLGLAALGIAAYHISYGGETPQTQVTFPEAWYSQYQEAKAAAQSKGTYLLIDFSTTSCSACEIIARTILTKPKLTEDLPITPVYINCSYGQDECNQLQRQFNVIGYPTIILLDPATETVIKKWSGELIDVSYDAFVAQVKELIKEK